MENIEFKQRMQREYIELNKSLECQLDDILEDRNTVHKIEYEIKSENNNIIFGIEPITLYERGSKTIDEAIEEALHLTEFINESYFIKFNEFWNDRSIICRQHPLIRRMVDYKTTHESRSDAYDAIVNLVSDHELIEFDKITFEKSNSQYYENRTEANRLNIMNIEVNQIVMQFARIFAK